jgi:leucyl aminopeptidase (aminopeptidase T)
MSLARDAAALLGAAPDPEYAQGARNAVRVCLRVAPGERVTLICDQTTRDIAASLAGELEAAGARLVAWVLEEVAARPMAEMPREILDDLESSQVSIFAVQAQSGELRSRMQLTSVVQRRRIRHAHMVNINRQIMCQGMRADFLRVDEISRRVLALAGQARAIRATSAAGSDFTAEFSSSHRWLKTSGIISEETWGNLPGGEVFTAPENVNGTLVVDGVVGDYLCAKYGDLAATPLTLRVKANRLAEIECANRTLEDEFWRYTHSDENSDRVGEFAIGTNIGVHDLIGHILQDEKYPGVHIAFGNPYGEQTGATWSSSTHIDVVARRFSAWADGRPIMCDGAFTADILA